MAAPALLATVAAALAFVFVRYTVDDAFISWRYGQNLVEAGVWNWNPTDHVRVEAYTNPLYTALSVVPALLRIPVELFFKVVGLALLAGHVLVVRRLDVPYPQRLALWAFALLNPVFFVHLFSGLETVSFALLTALAFGLVYVRGSLGRWGHLTCLALALTRPEGMALAAAAQLWNLAVRPTRRDLYAASALGVALAGYWAARAWYFGRFFPNPFYEKSVGHGSWIDGALTGGAALWALLLGGAACLAAAVLAVALLRRTAAGRLRDATPLVLAVCAAVIHIGLYQHSVLAMNYADRFSFQILFPVALVALARPLDSAAAPWSLTATAVAAGTELTFEWQPWLAVTAGAVALCAVYTAVRRRRAAAYTVVGVAMAAVAVLLVSDTPPRQLAAIAAYRHRLSYAHEALGRAMADDPDLRGTVAIGDAGITPFCLGRSRDVYDLLGLADPYLRRTALPARLMKRVQLVVALGTPNDPKGFRFTTPTSRPLLQRAYATGFVSAGKLRFTERQWQDVLVRPGTRAPALSAMARRAQRENLRPDTAVLRDHLLDFPFLSQC
ncbi:hypothetical protein ACWD4J_37185 [Streptomyces sp. NPDC002577]